MIRLAPITEANYAQALQLRLFPEQQRFLDTPAGIIARGYVYRICNARVLGIVENDRLCGLLLVRDLTDDPACYDLQQFMIDCRSQQKGIGHAALTQLLDILTTEARFPRVDVCVDQANLPALHLFQAAGFTDTGYVAPDLPHCRNLTFDLLHR